MFAAAVEINIIHQNNSATGPNTRKVLGLLINYRKMKIVIAEKPSAAMEIIKAIQKIEGIRFERKNGFYQSKKIIVTWCVGHLIGLAYPSEYENGWEKWDLKNLPMIPTEWKYTVKDSTKKQFKIIEKILKKKSHKSAQLINACDPAREGELIFLLLLIKTGLIGDTNNVFRLWLNSFVFEDIEKAWKNLKTFKDMTNLGQAALSRSKADWILGMNASRFYGMKQNIKGLSIGRVKTPTLALVVKRYNEIINWKDRKEYKLVLNYKDTDFIFYELGEDSKRRQFANRETLEDIIRSISAKNGFICEVVKKDKIEYHPKPFDLTRLQREANKRFKFTAKKTLSIVQKLYEAKLTSYPRTDSDYLTESMLGECIQLLEIHFNTKKHAAYLDDKMDDKPIFNDKKVTDHYAIIPTKNKFNKEDEKFDDDDFKVYSLIKSFFVLHFLKPHLYSETSTTIDAQKQLFDNVAKKTTQMGYKAILQEQGYNAPSHDFSKLLNQPFKVDKENLEIVEVKISKPKPHTEASLLSSMQRCGNDLGQEAKDILKGKGIGTPATRAGVIEALVTKEYIERKKNYLLPTPLGLKIIDFVSSELASPEITGEWELKLNKIEKGTYTANEYLGEINNLVVKIVS